jgi:hypothetical protein
MVRDPRTALDHNYVAANRVFASGSDRSEYRELRGATLVSCGLPVEQLNWGFLEPPYDDLDATAGHVRSYFESRGLPFRLTFRGDHRLRVQTIESRGWERRSDPTPGMTLSTSRAAPRSPSRLLIHEVRTEDQLVAFREAVFRGFGYPVAGARIFLGDHLLGLPGVRLYSGLVEGVVVATSMVFATGEVAGIYWVATLEEQRARGYGAALTWAAVAGGRELGCEIASLQASKIGFPVYAHMGFEHVLDYEHLHPVES